MLYENRGDHLASEAELRLQSTQLPLSTESNSEILRDISTSLDMTKATVTDRRYRKQMPVQLGLRRCAAECAGERRGPGGAHQLTWRVFGGRFFLRRRGEIVRGGFFF